MICKTKNPKAPTDRFGKAGYEAEKQMAFYLRRAFAESSDVFVFNDLRLVRNEEVAQIDHLVLHRYGFYVIESKSVTDSIEVNANLEFTRVYGSRRTGMKSPLVQANMQVDLLRSLLNDHKERLREKRMAGLSQPSFQNDRFNILVAISDQGVIQRKGGNPDGLVKADQVPAIICERIDRGDRTMGVRGFTRYLLADEEQGRKMLDDKVPALTASELQSIREFLLIRHQEYVEPPPISREVANFVVKPSPPPVLNHSHQRVSTSSASHNRVPACRHCGGNQLEIRYGKYGYYFKCHACDKNTKISSPHCDNCGSETKIRIQGNEFQHRCTNCGNETNFFANPA
jgi:hypothetical protein